MVSNQVEPRRRYQSGELLNQFQREKQQMRGTIRPRRLKAKGQLFVVGDLQAASCQRRARGVTDEALQTGSVVVVDAGGRMQREAAGGETQGGPAHCLGNIAQQTTRCPARSPVASCPCTEAAERAACSGSDSLSSSTKESSSRPRRCSRRTMRWAASLPM